MQYVKFQRRYPPGLPSPPGRGITPLFLRHCIFFLVESLDCLNTGLIKIDSYVISIRISEYETRIWIYRGDLAFNPSNLGQFLDPNFKVIHRLRGLLTKGTLLLLEIQRIDLHSEPILNPANERLYAPNWTYIGWHNLRLYA